MPAMTMSLTHRHAALLWTSWRIVKLMAAPNCAKFNVDYCPPSYLETQYLPGDSKEWISRYEQNVNPQDHYALQRHSSERFAIVIAVATVLRVKQVPGVQKTLFL